MTKERLEQIANALFGWAVEIGEQAVKDAIYATELTKEEAIEFCVENYFDDENDGSDDN